MAPPKVFEMCAPDKLLSCLYQQKQSGSYCDIELRFWNAKFPVHGCVIGSLSSFVDRLVTSREKGVGKSFVIDVPVKTVNFDKENQYCQDCAQKVVDFMYFRRILVSELHIPHVYVLAGALEVHELLKVCESSLKCNPVKSELPIKSSPCANSLLEFSTAIEDQTDDIISSAVAQCKVHPDNGRVVVNDNVAIGNVSNETSCLELGWTVLDSSKLMCPKCKETFTNVVMLQQHCNSHLEKVYSCYSCKYSTFKVPDLLKHLKDTNHVDIVCSLCLFVSESSTRLKEHLKEHDHPQPFFCWICLTRFQTRTALNSHLVKHSTETPYICSVCGRGFKWKQGLQSHMIVHTSVKNHLCDQCGYSTAHLKSFQDHKMIHSGKKFTCPVSTCDFTSVRKESVKHHLLTHSKEKPYQCEVCGQAFSQAKNLRRHATTHDPSANIEKCPLCSFKTMRSDKIRDHFRKAHRGSDNLFPLKHKRAKTKPLAKTGGENFKVVPKTNKELKSSKGSLTVSPFNVAKADRAHVPALKTSVFSKAFTGSQNSLVPCKELPPSAFPKGISLANSIANINNLVIASPQNGLLSVNEDQVNLLMCNPGDAIPEYLHSMSINNPQNIDAVSLVQNTASLEQVSNPLIFQCKVQDTLGSEVEVSCLDQPLYDLTGAVNSNIFVSNSTENGAICLPFTYSGPDLHNFHLLSPKLGSIFNGQFNVLLPPEDSECAITKN